MRAPNRRVIVCLTGNLVPLGRTTIVGAREASMKLSCMHRFDLVLHPDRAGVFESPKIWPCPICPEVPDSRVNVYLDGGAIPALVIAKIAKGA